MAKPDVFIVCPLTEEVWWLVIQTACGIPRAAGTNYHRLGGFKQQEGVLSGSGGQNLKSWCWWGCASSKGSRAHLSPHPAPSPVSSSGSSWHPSGFGCTIPVAAFQTSLCLSVCLCFLLFRLLSLLSLFHVLSKKNGAAQWGAGGLLLEPVGNSRGRLSWGPTANSGGRSLDVSRLFWQGPVPANSFGIRSEVVVLAKKPFLRKPDQSSLTYKHKITLYTGLGDLRKIKRIQLRKGTNHLGSGPSLWTS